MSLVGSLTVTQLSDILRRVSTLHLRRQASSGASEEVTRLLQGHLTDGTYKVDERLPSEPVLAATYSISRPTLREILTGLERAGLVRRVHGVGTFVTRPADRVASTLDLDFGITEAVVAANADLDLEVHDVREKPLPDWMATNLELDQRAPALFIERIVRVNGKIAAHVVDAIPSDIVANAQAPTYSQGSVYRYLEDVCGVHLIGGTAEILPVSATPRLVKFLQCPRSTPLLRLEQTERSVEGRPVLFSQEHYLPGIITLTVQRRRRQRPVDADDALISDRRPQ